MQENLAALVENENVHGAVAQLLGVHFAPRPLADHVFLLIHHVEDFAGQILRFRGVIAGRAAHQVGQLHPLREAQFLGAGRVENLHPRGDLRPVRQIEILPQQLPALRKALLHQAREERAVAVGHFVIRTRRERDDGGVHLWHRRE